LSAINLGYLLNPGKPRQVDETLIKIKIQLIQNGIHFKERIVYSVLMSLWKF